MGSPGELLSRRCVALLKNALRTEVWPNTELKLSWFDKILMTVETQQPNFSNVCTALELLGFLLGILVSTWSGRGKRGEACAVLARHSSRSAFCSASW